VTFFAADHADSTDEKAIYPEAVTGRVAASEPRNRFMRANAALKAPLFHDAARIRKFFRNL